MQQAPSIQCPVCGNAISKDASICGTCDSDLTLWLNMSNLPEDLCEAGRRAMENDQYEAAVKNFQLALDFKPTSLTLLKSLAEAHRAAGNIHDETQAWDQVLDLAPDDPDANRRVSELASLANTAAGRKSGAPWIWGGLGLVLIVLAAGWMGYYWAPRFQTAVTHQTASQGSPGLRQSGGPSVKSSRPVPLTAQDRVISELGRQLPSGVKASAKRGGIYINGEVNYPWQKEKISSLAGKAGLDFVDLSGLGVRWPQAFLYEIKAGDTLSRLAGRYLGDPLKWRILLEVNKNRMSNPDQLLAGQKIVLLVNQPRQ